MKITIILLLLLGAAASADELNIRDVAVPNAAMRPLLVRLLNGHGDIWQDCAWRWIQRIDNMSEQSWGWTIDELKAINAELHEVRP